MKNYLYLINNSRFGKLDVYHRYFYLCYNNAFMRLDDDTKDISTKKIYISKEYNFDFGAFIYRFSKYIVYSNEEDCILLKVPAENENFDNDIDNFLNKNGFYS